MADEARRGGSSLYCGSWEEGCSPGRLAPVDRRQTGPAVDRYLLAVLVFNLAVASPVPPPRPQKPEALEARLKDTLMRKLVSNGVWARLKVGLRVQQLACVVVSSVRRSLLSPRCPPTPSPHCSQAQLQASVFLALEEEEKIAPLANANLGTFLKSDDGWLALFLCLLPSALCSIRPALSMTLLKTGYVPPFSTRTTGL